jgi:hypothetical protein
MVVLVLEQHQVMGDMDFPVQELMEVLVLALKAMGDMDFPHTFAIQSHHITSLTG